MKKTKTQKGITLIALIITIIVLLILAVVAIQAVTGDGIIQHAENATTEYQRKSAKEELQLSIIEAQLGNEDVVTKLTNLGAVCTANGECYDIVYKGEEFTLAKDNSILNKEELNTIKFTVSGAMQPQTSDSTDGAIGTAQGNTLTLYMPGAKYTVYNNSDTTKIYIIKFNGVQITEFPYTIEEEGELVLQYAQTASSVIIKNSLGEPVKYENLTVVNVTFDLNGGVGEVPETITKSITQSGALYELPYLEATKEGHVFLGWNTVPNSANAYGYLSVRNNPYNCVYVTSPSNIKLYAIWAEASDYNIYVNRVLTTGNISSNLCSGINYANSLNLTAGSEIYLESCAGNVEVKLNDESILSHSGAEETVDRTIEVESDSVLTFNITSGQVKFKISKDGNEYNIYQTNYYERYTN